MKQILLSSLFVLFVCSIVQAQNNIGIGTSTPDASAMLEILSNNKGLLVPRMTATERMAIPTPANALLVYDTDSACFYYYKQPSTSWINLCNVISEIDPEVGSNTVNLVPKWDGNALISGSIYDNGNVGIGTLSPASKLDVVGIVQGTEDAVFNAVNVGKGGGSVSSNTGIGTNALTNNTTGFWNTALGVEALFGNSTTEGNSAFGYRALSQNSIGNKNTAIGAWALGLNGAGYANDAVGYDALTSNSGGFQNSAQGFETMRSNLSGNRNTAMGGRSLFNNIAGSNNTALGFEAGVSALGSGNVFLGYQAGKNESGSNKLYLHNTDTIAPLIYGDFATRILAVNGNVGIGTTTPNAKLDVDGNLRVRNLSGNGITPVYANEDGDFIVLEEEILGNSDTIISFIGNGCSSVTTDTITLSGMPDSIVTSDIGISVNFPNVYYTSNFYLLLITPNGDTLVLNAWDSPNSSGTSLIKTYSDDGNKPSGKINLGTGFTCGFYGTVSSFGSIGGGSINPNGKWILVFWTVPVPFGGNGGTLDGWSVNFSEYGFGGITNYVPIWRNNGLLSEISSIYDNGNVGIGTIHPANKLSVSGNANITGNVGIGTTSPTHILHISGQGRSTNSLWATSSDKRVKKNIYSLTDSSLEKILKLRPVTYEWTSDYFNKNTGLKEHNTGFISQELEKIFPEMVEQVEEKYGEKTISDFRLLNLSDLPIHIVKAIQEQQEIIEEQRDHIEELVSRGEQRDELINELKDNQVALIKQMAKLDIDVQ